MPPILNFDLSLPWFALGYSLLMQGSGSEHWQVSVITRINNQYFVV
jgi:hypothetical protein